MGYRRMGVAATAAGLALVLAACGGSPGDNAKQQQGPAPSGAAGGPTSSASQQAPAQPGQAGVRWIDGFCSSVAKFMGASQSAQPPKSQDPAAIKQAMSERLGRMATGAETVVADLDAMNPSPIDGGDKLISSAKQTYTLVNKAAEKAKSTIDSAPASNMQAVKQAVQSASKEFQQVKKAKSPFKQLQSNKKLATAFRQAPQCKQLVQAAQQRQQAKPGAGRQPAPGPGN